MNKGEWSEFYTFLRLLADGKLYAADADLNKIEDLYYPLIKVIRQSKNHKEPLFYEIGDKKVTIVDSSNNNELGQVSKEDFTLNADKLLKIIKNAPKGSFEAQEINDFTTEIECPLVKEKSASKRDITVVIHDINTGHQPEVGFSIKSKLGGDSTLFNSNKTTNLTYKVNGLSSKISEEVNHPSFASGVKAKVQFLVNRLHDHGCTLDFESIQSSNFNSNLQMIDSNFPNILSEMLKIYYSGHSKKISDLSREVALINPCGFVNNNIFSFYEHKIKGFLTACALGMTSAKPWNGSFDVSGGYIIVKENGDVLCYHIYNWNDFQKYLFHNTYIDTPSTGRHKFGSLEGDKLNLNFQIRFK